MKRIVYLDGGVLCVAVPVVNTHPEPEQLTEQQAIDRALARLPATASDVRVLDESALPATRAHRALWTYNAGKTAVIVDAAAAAAADAKAASLASIDADIEGDAQWKAAKAMTRTELNTYLAGLQSADVLPLLRRLVRVMVRRVP